MNNGYTLYKKYGDINMYINGDVIIEINEHSGHFVLRKKLDDDNSLYICDINYMRDIHHTMIYTRS